MAEAASSRLGRPHGPGHWCGLRRYRPDEQVRALLVQAEALGRIRTRTNPFVREIISTMLARARRESVARDVRGMADRMGLLKTA